MSKTYYMDHPTKNDYEIEIPSKVRDEIIIDFLRKTYYWSFGIACIMIGFLLGIMVN